MDPWARVLAESQTGPTLLVAADGTVLVANGAWRALCAQVGDEAGIDPDSWRDLVTDASDLERLDIDNSDPDVPSSSWLRLRRPDGGAYWWLHTRSPVLDESGRRLGAIIALSQSHDPDDPQDAAWRVKDVLTQAELIAHIGAWDWDIPSGSLWWSDEVYRIFGLAPQKFPATYEGFLEYIHPDDRDEVRRRVSRAIEGVESYDLRHRVLRPDGQILYVREQGSVTRDGTGAPVRMLGTVQDITTEALEQQTRRTAMMALQASEARYRLLSDNTSDVVVQVDEAGLLTWVSNSVTSTLGWLPEQVLGRPVVDFVLAADRVAVLRTLGTLQPGAAVTGRYRVRRADGSYVWMAASSHRGIFDDEPLIVTSLRDVSDEVGAREELAHVIAHDPLTGVPTRTAMLARLVETLNRSAGRVAVLCIGVDTLTSINEAVSHAAGDHVLAEVTDRIGGALGSREALGRGAGNEIIVLCSELKDAADAGIVAERIRLTAQGLIGIAEHRIEPTVSIGIALGVKGDEAEQLLRQASLAMRQAKLKGRDRWEFVDDAVAAEASTRLQLELDIRQALRDRVFVPWYQPIVSLADRGVVGHEALVRWPRNGGVVEAGMFVPVAEHAGLIVAIDTLVMQTALTDLAAFPRASFVGVNVSAATLRAGGYEEQLFAVLGAVGLEPSRVHLEVTETALLDETDAVRATMNVLAESGAQWYVDDFGTGYSSIRHLRDLPIAGLKLDRSFTAALESDPTSRNLSGALAALARGLNLDTVAEGIETEEQARILTDQGWRHGQGWLFGRPAPSLHPNED